MRALISFDTDNAAFGDPADRREVAVRAEVKGILDICREQIVDAVTYGHGAKHKIRDSNGNTIGVLRVEMTTEEAEAVFTTYENTHEDEGHSPAVQELIDRVSDCLSEPSDPFVDTLQDTLDDMVHDAMSHPASAINNEGSMGQLLFLLDNGLTVKELTERLFAKEVK